MGACLSCCGQGTGPDGEAFRAGSRFRDTEADRQARAAAAQAAAQRQATYETSAVGKAVAKSVRAAKPDQRYKDRAGAGGPTSQDWIN
eukprot:jgi/Picre1/35372/NNA_002834.t1